MGQIILVQVDDQDERRSQDVESDVQDGLVGALARALASRRVNVESGENWKRLCSQGGFFSLALSFLLQLAHYCKVLIFFCLLGLT